MDRLLWYEALRDTLRATGNAQTLHILCAVPALCLRAALLRDMEQPYVLRNMNDPNMDLNACGHGLGTWDVVLLVAHSNSSMMRLIRACRSNKPR